MADWLLETVGDVRTMGLDSAWQPFGLRHAARDGEPMRKPSGLSARRLGAVLGYIREHLHASLTLRDLAAVAHLSPYHFARRFKESTGLPPHQYIIARRIERAQQLLRGQDDLSSPPSGSDDPQVRAKPEQIRVRNPPAPRLPLHVTSVAARSCRAAGPAGDCSFRGAHRGGARGPIKPPADGPSHNRPFQGESSPHNPRRPSWRS
jgi:AraC-like DNA-binding protein